MAKRGGKQNSAHEKLRINILKLWGPRDDLMLMPRKQGIGQTTRGQTITFGTKGEPDITGTWRRSFEVRTVKNPHSFQPFERIETTVIGVSIAIEVKTGDAKLSKFQEAWRGAFERMGGIFIEARSEADVEAVLGRPLA